MMMLISISIKQTTSSLFFIIYPATCIATSIAIYKCTFAMSFSMD